MNEHNPYVPSRASLAHDTRMSERIGSGTGVWREGDILVMQRDARMPGRCVKCNGPAHEPTKSRTVYWHPPAIYLLILINIVVYAVVGAILRKKATVAAGLCAQHRKARLVAITAGWIGLLCGLVLMAVAMGGMNGPAEPLVIGGVVLALVSILAAMIFARVVYAKRIDSSYVRLKGCGSTFLDSLPVFPG